MSENTAAESAPVVDAIESVDDPRIANHDNLHFVLSRLLPNKAAKVVEIQRANGAASRNVDEIAAELAQNSTDPKIVKLRDAAKKANDDLTSALRNEADAVKANAGEPDIDSEKKALASFKSVESVFVEYCKDAGIALEQVQGLIPSVGPLTRANAMRKVGDTKAKNPNAALVRDWARQNGKTVNERGAVSSTLIGEWEKATGQTFLAS